MVAVMLDLNKEREAFNENFGLPESDDCFLGETSPEQKKLMLKCHWLGWQRCAETKQAEIDQLKSKLADAEKAVAHYKAMNEASEVE